MGQVAENWLEGAGSGQTAPDAALSDMRFRALVGEAAWAGVSPAISQRFGKRLGPEASVTYAGAVVECRRSWIGKTLATLSRLIGAPLPLRDDTAVPAVVAVTEDGATGAQMWTRIYGRPHGFPQVIHSSKRFAGPTGLEEYLGSGFGIALTVSAESTALHFRSDHYFLTLGGRRLPLPHWLSPGHLTVSHLDQGDGLFAFVLVLRHPLAGELIRQTCLFRERFIREIREDPHD